MKDQIVQLIQSKLLFILFVTSAGLLWGSSVFAVCNSDIHCTYIYNPVCGEDGQTYSNACVASAACVDVVSTGVCEEPPPACIDRDNDKFSPNGGECGPVDCNDLDLFVNPDMACPEIYEPVCGVDGETYSSSCEALRVCVHIDHPGECVDSPVCVDEDEDGYSPVGGECGPIDCDDSDLSKSPGAICTTDFSPVCGVDGKTYGNTCEAERECIEVAHFGVCSDNPVCTDEDDDGYSPDGGECGPIDCDDSDPSKSPGAICLTVVSPVCGVDGNTYGNECEASRECVEVAHLGVCETPPVCTVRNDMACTAEYDPVCGVDGNTYGNACEAKIACVEIAHTGECETPSVCTERPDSVCTTEFDPVCGVNGRTYGNACEASRECMEIAHRGSCRWWSRQSLMR